MDNDNRTLFDRLLRAETERTVSDTLATWGYNTDAEAVWQPLGGMENNFTIVGNQQSDATGALVEKLINGIDAVLMRECYDANIDPEGLFAPKGMAEAVEAFFRVKDGKIGNVGSAGELTKIADKNLHLIVTSENGKTAKTANPCYLMVDTGEGQTPDRFPDTFCSLSRSNKLRIPFVQGKFNAGGTGVLQFCGDKNYQLIASRRNPNAPTLNGDGTGDLWGFTLIRRLRPADGRRSSVYVYLAPNGRVPRFAAPAIPALTVGNAPNKPPVPYAADLEYGTVVKLYEYKWRARSILTTEGRYELQRYLQGPALPFRVTETRAYGANYYSATVAGIWAEVALPEGSDPDAESARVEKGFPAYASLNLPGIGNLPYQIAVFREATGVKRREPTGVFFVLNGQVHGALPSNFISSKLKFDYLASSLLVSVDCTRMNAEVREDFFMASRDRLRRNEVYDLIFDRLATDLREHAGLRELNSVRRQQEIEKSLSSDSQALEVFQYLLKADPTLATLLGAGDRLVTSTGPGEIADFTGKKFPTFFRLKKDGKSNVIVKHCPLNRTVRVEWETDAANDYFERTDSPGDLIIRPGELCEHWRLWNGEFTARFRAPEGATIGDHVETNVTVSDIEREKYRNTPQGPFATLIDLVVDAEDNSVPTPSSTSSKPSTKTPNTNGKVTAPRLALPNIAEIRRDDWQDKYNEHTALRIRHGENESYDFVVNMDNTCLLTELKRSPTADKSMVAYWFKYGLALCAMGVLLEQKQNPQDAENSTEPDENNSLNGEDLDVLGRLTDGLARVIVPVIRSLSKGPRVPTSV